MFKSENQKIILVILCFLLAVAILVTMFPREYSRSAYVGEIRGEVVKLVDGFGNVWEWTKEKENFVLGEKVILTFNNNGTEEDVKDDIIIRIDKEIKK
jgi:hypothetical protein